MELMRLELAARRPAEALRLGDALRMQRGGGELTAEDVAARLELLRAQALLALDRRTPARAALAQAASMQETAEYARTHGGEHCVGRGRQRDRAPAITLVLRVRIDQVALFQLDRDQDAGGRQRGEHQVGGGHHRGRPERKQPTDMKRVTHLAIQPPGLEGDRGVLAGTEGKPHLAQSEQVEVVDQERGVEHQQPATGEQSVQHSTRQRLLDRPDHPARRLPEGKQGDQSQA
jgi:hypothetical protein